MIMEEKLLLAELTKNCESKKEKVLELLKNYELAELGRKVWREHFKEIGNRVLNEHKFFAEKECCGHGVEIHVGDRITDEKWDFLLSDDDFDRLQKILTPIYVAENLTDEDGFYITNWDAIVCDARCELVDYVIKEIIPNAFREIFWEHRRNIVYQEKLIKITKDAFMKKSVA